MLEYDVHDNTAVNARLMTSVGALSTNPSITNPSISTTNRPE